MNKMKKIVSLMLTLALVGVTMIGCGSTGVKRTPEGVLKEGVLLMGTNAEFPPYEYHEGDEIVGIDVEIAEAIAEKLGMKLEIKDMNFDSIIAAVDTGKVDIGVAGMTVTKDRLKNVNFTESYATGVQAIIVKDGSDIATVDDLSVEDKTRKIGVQSGTTGDIYISGDVEDDTINGEVKRFDNGASAVQALMSGKLDCVVIDNQPALEYVKANKGLHILDTEYIKEEYAIAVAKDNDKLTNSINKALKELKEDGTIQAILDKYIKAE